MQRLRIILCLVGVLGVGLMLAVALVDLPDFGATRHPYGDRAVAAALENETANAVASVTFDQRAVDTLGEEFILFTAAVGGLLLLRRTDEEMRQSELEQHGEGEAVFAVVRLAGLLMLPVTLTAGGYTVLHGHISVGGGFQGGVLLASGVHVAYLAGDLAVLERLRDVRVFDVAEAAGVAAIVAMGLAAMASGSAFLTNVLPHGRLTELLSGGTVPLLNIATGTAVASALVVLLAKFLEQALVLDSGPGRR